MDSDAIADWIEENGRPETEWIDGPEHTRGPWEYECMIRVATFLPETNDKLFIFRSNADGSESLELRFAYYFPSRALDWQFGPSFKENPSNTGELRRYADILAAVEPLVDFDAAWEERTDITPARRKQLREAIDRDWALVQDPIDQEYTAAYCEAKRPLTQFARTPDQLRAWLEATDPDISINSNVVTLAYPEGAAPDAGPQPEAHPHWSGVDAEEQMRPGWSR